MSLQVTTGLQKSFVCVCVCAVCAVCKKNQKTFVYINYSVCIDVCETKIINKKKKKAVRIRLKLFIVHANHCFKVPAHLVSQSC